MRLLVDETQPSVDVLLKMECHLQWWAPIPNIPQGPVCCFNQFDVTKFVWGDSIGYETIIHLFQSIMEISHNLIAVKCEWMENPSKMTLPYLTNISCEIHPEQMKHDSNDITGYIADIYLISRNDSSLADVSLHVTECTIFSIAEWSSVRWDTSHHTSIRHSVQGGVLLKSTYCKRCQVFFPRSSLSFGILLDLACYCLRITIEITWVVISCCASLRILNWKPFWPKKQCGKLSDFPHKFLTPWSI